MMPSLSKSSLRFLLVLAASTCLAVPLAAQSVPTGYQEYFVLGFEQHVWDMLTRVQTGEGGPAFADGTNSVVSATASADNQIVTYDHWEDGLEADITAPVQATTLVIGDGNSANGRACDFTTDPRIFPCDGIDDDLLFAGSFVNFNSDQGLGCAAPPNDTRCSVPVNPRNPADIRFDGGDLLVSSGGPLVLVHPQDPLSPFIGGATEIIPRQAVANATLYSIPVGEDIYLGNNTLTEPFKYVDLDLLAFDDNTSVNIASPGAGSVSFTLNRGQHYSSQGLIGSAAAPAITVNAGTRISTSGPLGGLIFTGGDGTFATRFYTLLPDLLHGSDYVITAPGDNPAMQGSRPLNLYIFNPDPLNALTVTATDSVGTSMVNVPAGQSVDYFTGTGRFVPSNSTVRMTSNRNFWGVSAYSHQDPANDWGHSWLSRKFVTANYTVPFAPGVNNPTVRSQPAQRLANDPSCTIPPAGPGVCDPLNRSPVFVSALVDNTHVQVDFDNDGVFDVIDLDGDDFPDPAPLPNNTYVVNALQSLRVYDHNDYDNTGTLVVANRPVAMAYGQDTDQATGPDPIQDTGYAIYPISQLFLDPVLVVDKAVNNTVLPTAGGVATYTVTVRAFDFGPLSSLGVFDLLPPGVTGADYVPGSTLVTYPDLSQDTADPVASIDPGTGRDRLDWTLSPDTIQANQTLTVRYSVNIPAAPGGTPRSLINEAHAEATLGGSTFSPSDTAEVVQSDVTLTKSVDLAQPEAGDVLTFTINVANNGLAAETGVVVSDPIPNNTTYVPASVTASGPFTGTYSAAQNAVVWTAASFPVGGPHALTFQVQVNPGTPSGTAVPNSASYESAQTPLFFSNEVDPVVVGPALVVSKTGPALLHPNEVATFEIHVDNVGTGAATNVLIVDPFPVNTTYVAGSMTWRKNVAAFAAVTDAADADAGTAFGNRVELAVASLGAGQDLTFRFQVRVNAGTGGLFVANQATVSSTEVPPVATRLVQIPIVGNADVTGHVFLDLDGDGTQDPGEPDLANVDVVVTDGSGVRRVTTDASGNYLATVALSCYEDGFAAVAYNGSDGDLDWSGAGDQWIEFGTGADQNPATTQLRVTADPLGVFGNSLNIVGGPGAGNRGFTRRVDLSAAAGFILGQVSLSFNYRRVSMESSDVVQLDIDYDNNGMFNDVLGTFPGAGTDGTWQSASFTLDAGQLPANPVVFRFLGTNFNHNSDNFYVDNVQVCNAQVSVDVDETDPDFPAGATLTTANDPQTVAAAAGGTVAATPVGYQPLPLTFTKVSDAGGEVVAGQTVTYTLTATNNTGVTQTGIAITDPLPTGTAYVPGSSQVLLPVSLTRQVSQSSDDAEQNVGSGAVSINSSDLELVFDNNTQQIVGVRFQSLTIPQGATIVSAEIEFETDEIDTGATSVVVRGQDVDNAATFAAVNFNLSGRVVTTASVPWNNVPPWSTVDERHRTPDLTAIVQEIVDRPGWVSANAMAFLVSAGAGCGSAACQRTAESFNGEAPAAPILHVTYAVTAAGGAPPDLVVPADGYTLAPNQSLIVTFQVTVGDPLAPGISQIVNTATLSTNQQGPFMASVTDDVVRLAVTVEPNNAGFTVAGGAVTYTHFVTNTGEDADSYNLTLISELGYRVELLDPDTGAVIAVDSNGDGVWDGGVTVNTGTLAVGESAEYRVRVNVPGGTPLGTEETTALVATSDRSAGTRAFATDETTVVASIDFGPVALDPDHSGVVAPGGAIAYTHTVTNNTGATDTFDLTAFPTLAGWTATIYNDSNGDGVYTPGIDVAIANTLQLSDGQLQTIFVVVTAPPGALSGDTDVVHLTAISRNDPALFDAATDTTTVLPATTHDLSGGGTRLVTPGATAVFPGTLKNLGAAADRFDFTITASKFYGLDGLNHPTELWVDTNADGVPDTLIATDADGDGDWDTITPGYDVDMDSSPDFAVPGGGQVAYELRRPVDPAQKAYRDPVTLSATSQATGEVDSVTATNLLAAATHALLAAFGVYTAAGEVVVEWTTASEVGTVGFYLTRTDTDGRSARLPRRGVLPGLLHAPQGGTYRFIDAGARPDALYAYRLVEVDRRGAERRFGPFDAVADRRRGAATSKLLAAGYVKEARTSRLAPPADPATPRKAAAPPSGWLRVPVKTDGMVYVTAADLAVAWGETEATVAAWIRSGQLRVALNPFPVPLPLPCAAAPGGVFRDGFESGDTCAWSTAVDAVHTTTSIAWLGAAGGAGLAFYGQAIDSPFTTDNVYWIGRGAGLLMGTAAGGAPPPAAGGSFPERLHFEREAYPLTSVIRNPDSDFWFWDFFIADNAAHGTKSFTVTTPGAVAATGATLTVRLHGGTDDEDVTPDHHVEVRWNGTPIGETRWDGGTAHRFDLAVPAGLVAGGDNTVEITSRLAAGVTQDVTYLESLDVAYARSYRAVDDRLEAPATAAVVTVEGFSAPDVTVFDVTDALRPRVVVDTTIDQAGAEHRVSFARHAPPARYLALRLAGLPAAALEVDLASGLRAAGNRADYLVLAGAGLETAAASLADYRRSRGFEAMTVRLQDVYDEFNGGVASPLAIRDFLAYARRHWQAAPRWVALAGDGSFDYKNLLGAGDNLVPALLAATADGLFPSDRRYVAGANGVPGVYVGRIPARTNAELAAYVAKLEAYEAAGGAWRGAAVWVADDADKGGEFPADTESLIPLAPSLAAERIYVDDLGAANARQGMLAALRSGALLVSYLGHGGPDRLADEGLLLTGDVAALDNAERQPVMTALTCSVGRFDFPGFDTLSETLVRRGGGGVVALLSPSGLSFNAEARQLGEGFLVRALSPSTTLGEAVAGALADYAASPGADRDLPYLVILLGDPAIRLEP